MGKTKAELEREVKVLRERLDKLEAPREGLDAPEGSPARSEVLPGGGVARGAVLHVRVPVAPEDAPALPVVSQAFLEQLGNLPEGEQAGTDEPRAFPIVDGGYANAETVEVLHHAGPGHVVVKVVR
jgi:hypothetical protein